ncbi:MATE family efflux transporter [Spiroplasma endosymbiont of Aspidapion aeneum]|uniref:MATE family efflux transporter n=1 Tax=Spiroplasma endosymbiont of Aspidapion aeneum TaxID=3066276 RepID=UPI00313D04A7
MLQQDSIENIRNYKIIRFSNPIWKVKNIKEILSMAIPIFIQLLFNVLIAQINLIIINWYDNKSYADQVSRATLAYVTFQFIPAFVAVGTIIVSGKLIGQGKKCELSKVVISGIMVNVFITLILVSLLDIFAKQMCAFVSPSDRVSQEDEKWIISFYRILNIQLLFSAILQVLAAPLQALKKSKHVSIGAIISNFVDITFVLLVLFVFHWSPLWVAGSVSLAVLFQIVYLTILNKKFINFKINKGKQINFYYAKEMLITGAPITCEMMLYFITTFVLSSCVARIDIGTAYGKDTAITIYRNLNSIVQYLGAFTSALGTTSSVFVARKIGEGDAQGAYDSAINCWKIGNYILFSLAVVLVCASWLVLKIFNTSDELINSYGYLFVFITCIRQLFDVANMTILRSLWAVGDLFTPIFISFITMGLAYVCAPLIIIFALHMDGIWALIIIQLIMILDPLSRTIIYLTRWVKLSWQKHIKSIDTKLSIPDSIGQEQELEIEKLKGKSKDDK